MAVGVPEEMDKAESERRVRGSPAPPGVKAHSSHAGSVGTRPAWLPGGRGVTN